MKSNLEPTVELVDLLFVRAGLVGIRFERAKRAGFLGALGGIGA